MINKIRSFKSFFIYAVHAELQGSRYEFRRIFGDSYSFPHAGQVDLGAGQLNLISVIWYYIPFSKEINFKLFFFIFWTSKLIKSWFISSSKLIYLDFEIWFSRLFFFRCKDIETWQSFSVRLFLKLFSGYDYVSALLMTQCRIFYHGQGRQKISISRWLLFALLFLLFFYCRETLVPVFRGSRYTFELEPRIIWTTWIADSC